MSEPSRQIHLNLFLYAHGHHEAAWRHPLAPKGSVLDIEHTIDCARKAEAAKFDSIFLADVLHIPEDIATSARLWLEPLVTLSAVAVATTRIGLIGTASTSYTEPYNLARQFASLDHLSKGRAAWNIVTSYSISAGPNFGEGERVTHHDRYERGEEFVQAVKALWDSWSDDAVLDDRSGGRYADMSKIRTIDYSGQHYNVRGPLNVPRSPQGWPVLVQAGSSESGRDFAARHGEAVFTAHLDKSNAQEFYADLKSRVDLKGRDPNGVLILPGISPMIAATEDEAKQKQQELNELNSIETGLARLSIRFDGYDFSNIKLDQVLSPDDFPDPENNEGSRSRTQLIIDAVKRERPTMRQLLATLAGARGHNVIAGAPEQIADIIIEWVDSGAADGFNVMPPLLPNMLDAFAEEVVPLLQKRGRFRTEYEGPTLRDHFGLGRPAA
ncbi:MAG: LLM class flavin-dependent oxidoreductase [Pseudomonadota bacterium]